MNTKFNINILLATYNGEKFLSQLLESIVAQSYPNWKIIVRDDNSMDNTLSILKSFQEEYPKKMFIIEDNFGNLGVCKNFEKLMNCSKADYIMFADQDDVWRPDKIEISLSKLIDIEMKNSSLPIMVHTDMTVVDEHLNILGNSFWEYNQIDICSDSNIKKLFYRNVATGCTMIFNKKAKNICLPFPPKLRIHDWWMNMQVAAKGKVLHLAEKTVLYRQHQNNIIGAKKKKFSFFKIFTNSSSYYQRVFNQYKAVQKLYSKINPIVFFIKLFFVELSVKIKQNQKVEFEN